MGKNIEEIAPEALEKLQNYLFPGNVRELKNIIKRAMVLAHRRIELTNLPAEVLKPKKEISFGNLLLPLAQDLPLMEASRQVVILIEKKLIMNALQKTNGHQKKAAKLLGIGEKTLYNKMKDLRIQKSVGKE